MPLRAPAENTRNFLGLGLTPCAAALSVEGSRLARRPPRKRREAAFTPRSETTIGTGLNSSGRDDIQTMDRQVFRVVVLRRNGTENRVKQLAVLSRIAAAAQFRRFGLAALAQSVVVTKT